MTTAAVKSPATADLEPVADRAGRIETHGTDYIPEAERHGKPRSLFAVWAASNLTYLYLVLGGTLILLGLNLWQAVGVIVAGNLLWIAVGYLSRWSPARCTESAATASPT